MAPAITQKSDCPFLLMVASASLLLTFFSGYSQVGIGTINPTSTLEVNGSFSQKVNTITATTTLTIDNGIVICNNGATPINVTLPDPVGISGRIYTIKRNASSSANVTIIGTINGAANLILTAAGQTETLFSDNAEWKSLSKYEASSTTGWSLIGNSGTTPGTNYVGTTDAQALVVKTNGTERMRVLSGGNIGIGEPSPTAVLHLKAGTTAAATAPLKFTTQAASLIAVEPGTMEYVGHSLQFSQFLKRRGIAMSEDVRTTSTTIANTTTESGALATVQHGAGYLEVGKSEETVIRGTIQQINTNNLAFTVKYAGATIHTLNTTLLNAIAVGTPFSLTIIATCRSAGTLGTMQINSLLVVAGENSVGGSSLASINTTIAQDTTVTATWSAANASNILVVEQSRTLCIEQNK